MQKRMDWVVKEDRKTGWTELQKRMDWVAKKDRLDVKKDGLGCKRG